MEALPTPPSVVRVLDAAVESARDATVADGDGVSRGLVDQLVAALELARGVLTRPDRTAGDGRTE